MIQDIVVSLLLLGACAIIAETVLFIFKNDKNSK